MANTLRAFLTALGIIFGVAAVIAMLAIGNGARQSILEQMKLIGANNIVVNSIVLQGGDEGEKTAGGGQSSSQEGKHPWSPGLSLEDVKALQVVLPNVELISPEVVLPLSLVQSGKSIRSKAVGVTNAFFELNNLQLAEGDFFHQLHLEGGKPVCIIGQNIKTRFFPEKDPLGQWIKCGTVWMKIIGVLEKRITSQESLESLGIRDYNSDVYVPVNSALLRIKDRRRASNPFLMKNQDHDENDNPKLEKNYNQLDKVVVRVHDSADLQVTAQVIAQILKRRHNNLLDFEVEVPELLLQQQQKTQDMFNFVLAVIAGISLLVGGIGIMNIMLASVLERIKEIGVRRSLGAKRSDIVWQFLFEAIFISLLGGIIGVLLGIGAAKVIASAADIPTIVSWASIFLSFGVAASVGLAFGLFPARKAAKEDPIKALRIE